MMYYVLLNTRGTEEAVLVTENKEEAQIHCDSLNKLTDGVEMGAYIRTGEEIEKIAKANEYYNSLTEEEKHDYIEINGKKYIAKIAEKNAMDKLFDYLNIDEDSRQDSIDNDYMTINEGRDGKEYAWYLDENTNVVCRVGTLEIIDDSTFIDDNFC